MAIVAREIRRNITSSGGRGTGVRVFRCHDDYSGSHTVDSMLDVFNAFGGTLPDKGTAFPEFAGLRCTDFTLTAVDGHADLWEVEFNYEQYSSVITSAPTTPITRLPNEVNYVEESQNIRAEFVSEYRANPNLSHGGDPDELQDIRGTPVDKAGTPVSLIRARTDLTVTETLAEPNLNAYRAARFKRNSATFRDVVEGKLMYVGAQVRRTGTSVFQVQHTFAEDDHFHLIQVPDIDQDGDPLLDEKGKHAKTVKWMQPFEEKYDFGALSTNFQEQDEMATRRFTQGRVGALGFEHVNEMMMGLDALTPMIEKDKDVRDYSPSPKERWMYVYATPSEADPEKYDWNEIAYDVTDTPIIAPGELLAAGQQFRSGSEEEGTYATCLTVGFEGGYALCRVCKNTNGGKRYFIAPVASSGLMPVTVTAIALPDYEVPDGPTMHLYEVMPVFYTLRTLQSGVPDEIDSHFGKQAYALNLVEYDNGANIPPNNTGADISVYPIQIGTRVMARKYPVVHIGGGGQEGSVYDFWMFSLMNRLRVEC